MTLYLRAAIALLIAGLLAFTHLTAYRSGRHAIQAKWDEAKVIQERQAQAQATRNRELQRAAELRYTVAAQTRDRFFVTAAKEIHRATENLAACVLSPAAVDRLRHAAECAGEDRPAACGAGEPVPVAGHAP